jgi:hypothetical protein
VPSHHHEPHTAVWLLMSTSSSYLQHSSRRPGQGSGEHNVCWCVAQESRLPEAHAIVSALHTRLHTHTAHKAKQYHKAQVPTCSPRKHKQHVHPACPWPTQQHVTPRPPVLPGAPAALDGLTAAYEPPCPVILHILLTLAQQQRGVRRSSSCSTDRQGADTDTPGLLV